MSVERFSSRRERLDRAFLAKRLANATSYRRIAGYRRGSILWLNARPELSCYEARSLQVMNCATARSLGSARRSSADEGPALIEVKQ